MGASSMRKSDSAGSPGGRRTRTPRRWVLGRTAMDVRSGSGLVRTIARDRSRRPWRQSCRVSKTRREPPGAAFDETESFLLPSPASWRPAPLPAHAQSGHKGVVVGAATDAAVVAQVDLRGRGDGGGGLEADDGGIACRRGAEHGEAVAGRAGKGGRDRPAGVGELVLPAQAEGEVELALVAEADRTPEIGADGGAQRIGGLLRDVEAERLRTGLTERILRHAGDLQSPERGDGRGGRRVDVHFISALGLAEELVGAGCAGGGSLR